MWILLVVAVGLCVGTFRALFNDGRPLRPPASHEQDPLFVAPGRQIEQTPQRTVFPTALRSEGQELLDLTGAPGETLQMGWRL